MHEMGVLCDFHGTLVDANHAWIKAFETYDIPDINQVITDVYHKVNRKIICNKYGINYEEIKNKYIYFLEVRYEIVNLVKLLSGNTGIIIVSNSSRERLLRDIDFVKPNLDLNILEILSKENGNKNDPDYINQVLDRYNYRSAYLVGNDIREDFNPSLRITNIFVPYKNTILMNKTL
ncbi:MAG: hypothetical protein IKN73_04045 [Alphaproteobacteria bacterium]|nr:hypothetical protein [Alphaproteobacteria bacterium]